MGISLFMTTHSQTFTTSDTKEKTIGILGLGHVGLTLGLTIADAGFSVRGFDIKADVREKIASGKAHFSEKGLDDLLHKNLGSTFTVVDALNDKTRCDIYIVTVGTPLDADKHADYGFIRSAGEDIGAIIKKGDLVILRSTVPLGTTRDVVTPIIEKVSGLKRGEFSIAFAPERTVEGNALYELRALPQIVGGLDERSTDITEALFKTFTDTVVRMHSLEEAEMVKLVNNTYRETVFSFANEISMIARKWGMDTKKVIESANAGYLRSNVPLPSPGVGGYCLTKDAYLLMESAEAKGVKPHLIHQARYVTAYILDSIGKEIEDFVREHHKEKKEVRIAILGFAFKGKPATSDTRGSTTPVLMKRLRSLPVKVKIVGYDPAVHEGKIVEMGADPVGSIEEAVRGSHIVIIMNNNPAFANLPHEHVSGADGKVMLYDTWGLHHKDHFKDHPHVKHSTL